MKCGLVQILAVAMLLGHTVSMLNVDAWMKSLRNLVIGEPSASGVAKFAESAAESGELQLANTLPDAVNAAIQQVTAYDFTKFNIANEEEAYGMVNELLDIKKHVKDSTHADRTKLLDNINTEIAEY